MIFAGEDDTPKSVNVLTIWLERPVDNKLRMFFCPNCQNPLFQYHGRAVMIIPGGVKEKPPTVIHQCSNRKCRLKYMVLDTLER